MYVLSLLELLFEEAADLEWGLTVDNGTPNVIGPLETVRSVLKSVGYSLVEHTNSQGTTTVLVRLFCTHPLTRCPLTAAY